jgi:ribonuclease HI
MTRKNLCRRNIIDNPRCPICDMEEETAVHVLWECPSAKDVWSGSSRRLQKSAITGKFFLQIAEDIFQRCSAEEILMFVCTARRIWLRRNEVVHGGTFLHPNTVVRRAQSALDEFGLVSSDQSRKQSMTTTQRIKHWCPPESGWVKVNWDAALDHEKGWMGYGAVVRDEHGLVVAAQCMTVWGRLDPTLAEAGAALKAILFSRSLGLRQVIFEGDTKTVVDGVNLLQDDWSSTGMLLEDIRTELKTIPSWRMRFVRREENKAAHALAKAATKEFHNQQWMCATPEYISEIARMERTELFMRE